jgi:hypothetical protein
VTVQEENKELREVVHDIVNEIHATLAAIDVTDARSLGDIAAGEVRDSPAPNSVPMHLTEYSRRCLRTVLCITAALPHSCATSHSRPARSHRVPIQALDYFAGRSRLY